MNALPIEDHGVIGDLQTAALVGTDAAIDFMCFPDFDSPTVFAALLDPARGGSFTAVPALPDARRKQMYLPETAVLLTRFLADGGVAEVADFMPPCGGAHGRVLVRWMRAVHGSVRFRVRCSPRFDYARTSHQTRGDNGTVLFEPASSLPRLRLAGTVPLQADGDDATAALTLHAGDTATFLLYDADRPDGR